MVSGGRTITIRLFGVDITVDQNAHQSHLQTHHATTTIDETSRKRKTTNPNQEKNEEERSDDSSLPKKRKILRLFGVDIPIDHLLPTSSQEDQPITQNPNQEEEEEAEEEEEEEEEEEDEAAARIPPPEFDPVLLFEKELTFSDVGRSHNRLLITRSHSLIAALTEEERGRVEFDFLRVVTRDTNGVEYTLQLKRWVGSGAIVLKHEWGKLVRANRLQRGDSVEGWGYRVDGQFRLLLDVIRNQLN